jgi:hypothetical protein
MSQEPLPAYVPPDKTIRIVATYAPGRIGDVVPEGRPETVEIELTGKAIPEIEVDELSFIGTLVDSLFRNKAPDTELVFNKPEATPSAVAEALRGQVLARGGRIR